MHAKFQTAPLRQVAGRFAVALALLISSAHAQEFEVASVKLARPDHGMTTISDPGAPRFTARNLSMTILLQFAYGIEENQISAKAGWLNDTLYDVDAKPPGDKPLTYEELRPYLQHLLAERFHLAVHHESRPVNGYKLVSTKAGLKMSPPPHPKKTP